MNNQPYHKELGATTACTMRASKGTTQVKEARTILKGDAWFSSVKALAAAIERGIEVVYQINSNHSLFPKQYIEESLKDALGSCHIVLESKHPSGADLVAIGYRYNSKVTLLLARSKNAGSARKGSPHEMKFADACSNVHVRLVNRLSAISDFFRDSNIVDKHNQVRQHELELEKKWETRDPYFRLTTTMISHNATDSWNLSLYHILFSKLQQKHNAEYSITILICTGILTK